MKKTAIIIAGLGFAFFQSCKEIGPSVDLGKGVQAGEDTAYTGPVETPQTKKVLAEEFTGVSCPPCPGGHELMKSIGEGLNKNLIVVAYHIFNYPQANPVEKDGVQISKYDFRTQDATDVGNNIYGGIGAMPLGGFDRKTVKGSIALNMPDWSAAATAAATETPPVNIHMVTTFDAATKEGTVKVTLSYTQEVTLKENLTVLITEDSIVDAQKKGLEELEEYDHEHVLRDIITPVIGTPIPAKVSPKVPGKTYERTFKFTVDGAWKPEHCNVIAFVSLDEANDRHIIQAEEVNLIQ